MQCIPYTVKEEGEKKLAGEVAELRANPHLPCLSQKVTSTPVIQKQLQKYFIVETDSSWKKQLRDFQSPESRN